MLRLPMKTPGVCYKSTRTLSHTSSAGKREELMASESQQSRVKCSQHLTDVSADGYTYICEGKLVYGVTLYLAANIKKKNTVKIAQFHPCQDGCQRAAKSKNKPSCAHADGAILLSHLTKFPSLAHTLDSSLKHHLYFREMERRERGLEVDG